MDKKEPIFNSQKIKKLIKGLIFKEKFDTIFSVLITQSEFLRMYLLLGPDKTENFVEE